MNPEKLFSYLDGTLSPADRAAVEQQLLADPAARREFEIARKIHAASRSHESREVVVPDEKISPRGAVLGRRVGVAFAILFGVNVIGGLLLIAHHERRSAGDASRETEMREQLSRALTQRVTNDARRDRLAVDEMRITAPNGQLDNVCNLVVAAATRLGGNATKGLPDNNRVNVLAEVPETSATGFHDAMAALAAGLPQPSASAPAAPDAPKHSFVVVVTEAPPSR